MSFLPPSPTLMNQAPLIADFTLSGPIVGLHRRGSDSSGQTLEGGGGQEGVGSISSKKTCQQNKILTNDRKDREIPPPFPSQTAGQPSLLGRWRHHLLRLAFFTMSPPENLSTCLRVNARVSAEEQVRFCSPITAVEVTQAGGRLVGAAAVPLAPRGNTLTIIPCFGLFWRAGGLDFSALAAPMSASHGPGSPSGRGPLICPVS